jgi:hypothetical protein
MSEVPNWISAISTAAAALTAIIAVILAYKQLGNLNKTLAMNVLSAVLQLESEMNARKERVDAVSAAIRKEGIKSKPNKALIEILGDELDGYLENWLNASDRLAYCIINGYLPERDWRVEYRQYFDKLVVDHESRFGAGTLYTNIVDLNHKWKRE